MIYYSGHRLLLVVIYPKPNRATKESTSLKIIIILVAHPKGVSEYRPHKIRSLQDMGQANDYSLLFSSD